MEWICKVQSNHIRSIFLHIFLNINVKKMDPHIDFSPKVRGKCWKDIEGKEPEYHYCQHGYWSKNQKEASCTQGWNH